MNSGNSKPSCPSAPPCSSSITLTIQGLGEVVSFKNNKVIARGRLLTKPQYAEWMRKCADSFALQLLSRWLTIGGETATGCTRPSWIASVVPLDDSVREIVEFSVRVMKVPKGEEGAEIVVETI